MTDMTDAPKPEGEKKPASKKRTPKAEIVRGSGSATLGFVDAMVERKRKAGKMTEAELKKYRADLAKRHGIKLPKAA